VAALWILYGDIPEALVPIPSLLKALFQRQPAAHALHRVPEWSEAPGKNSVRSSSIEPAGYILSFPQKGNFRQPFASRE
jgi:hypothetical protein